MNSKLNIIDLLAARLSDFAWGWPLIIVLIGGGLYLFAFSRGLPLRGFILALKIVTGKFHHANDVKAKGQISHFKALTNAIAATVGLGNIGGVAVAISTGGPGAVFWMWVAAFLGMN
ncbi:MAG: sodium:alanine symporter family protein, partial [Bdellovibrionales bacterium]|nr:sodium:alanine symporter family protein [Bdellovibrionales bacterium]